MKWIMIPIIAIILSALSIVSSIICFIFTFLQNKKINKINMNARIYNEIFDKFLIERIPKARTYLRFENNKLVDSEQLSDTLADLLNTILYFRYADKKFYELLHTQIQDIEDFVLECGNKQFVQEEQGRVFDQIQDKLEILYKTVNDNYIGK